MKKFGFMNENLVVAFNDVDFCLKIRSLGKLIVYNPYIQFKHYESKTRGYEDSLEKQERFEKEKQKFFEIWKEFLEKGDPYYNINLSLETEQYNIKTFAVNQ